MLERILSPSEAVLVVPLSLVEILHIHQQIYIVCKYLCICALVD